MTIENANVFVTGANRGIGRALVEELLERGAGTIYAAARNPESVSDLVALDPERVTAIALDITDRSQVEAAARAASDSTVLINNAGVLAVDGIVDGDPELMRRDMETNYFGTANMVQAFAPVIESNGGGSIANVLSVVSLAPMPMIGGYSASKAAAFSLTQTARTELRDRKIAVHGVYPGPVDTDMTDGFEMEKATPQGVAKEILDGIDAGTEDIFPDAMAAQAGTTWLAEPKNLERQFAGAAEH